MNARSIVNKRDELELLVKDEDLDIVGISETWLSETISDAEISIDGYTIVRRDRVSDTKKRGGGVAFYIKNDINVLLRDDLCSDLFPECLFCSIENNGEKTLVGVCYRPPDSLSSNDDGLYEIISRISGLNCVFLGDFNFSEIKWDRPETISDEHPFIKCINDNFMIQLVDEPTSGENFLDLLLSGDDTLVENLTVDEPFESSDHHIVRFNLISKKLNGKTDDTYFNYFKANYGEMTALIKNRNWGSTLNSGNVEKDWGSIKAELTQLKDTFVPMKKRTKNKCKWVTKTVVKLRRSKVKAWSKYVRSGKDSTLYDEYKQKLRISVQENKKAKLDFEEKLANNIKRDNKSFYAYVRSKQRNKVKVGPLKDTAGNVITDNKKAADLLNEYFASVFTVEDTKDIPSPLQLFEGNQDTEGLNYIEIDEALVRKKLSELNVNKSPGPDELHPKLLNELREVLAEPLMELFKSSLDQGIVPQGWKEATVSPLYKKGKRDKPENYRPVSLTSIVGRILESIIKDKIVEHLDKFKLIRASQHGFTRGRSCLTNLLDFIEVVTKNLDKGQPVDLIYLDFAKAFDKVPFIRLLKKLEAHGIGGYILQWIKNWLNSRRQKVCINKVFSEWIEVTSGVPQGSVLGPVLFLIYINDLDCDIISKIGKFADDTKMCKAVSSSQDIEILQSDLNSLHKWSNDWQMQFNVDKCSVIHVGHNNKLSNYKLGNSDLKSSDSERDLGVIMDSSMKFSEQCNTVVKQANSTLGLIRRTIKFKRKDIIVRLYKALVRPKLEYCIQAWRPHLRKDIKSLEQIQHRATKMIPECRNQEYEARLRSTGLISVEDRYTRGDLIQVFKILKGIDKVEYSDFFKLVQDRRTRGHQYKIVKSRSRLDLRKHFFSQRVVNICNSLPSIVVEADSVNSFKNRLDKHWQAVAR